MKSQYDTPSRRHERDTSEPSKSLLEQAWHEFRVFLRSRRARITETRRIVLTHALQRTDHFQADDLAKALSRGQNRVSRGTVYRTLALLVELGLATENDFDEGFKRYEAAVGTAQHDHLICTACGKVLTFQHRDLERIIAEVAQRHGFEAITRQVKVFGTCGETEACRELARAYGNTRHISSQ